MLVGYTPLKSPNNDKTNLVFPYCLRVTASLFRIINLNKHKLWGSFLISLTITLFLLFQNSIKLSPPQSKCFNKINMKKDTTNCLWEINREYKTKLKSVTSENDQVT